MPKLSVSVHNENCCFLSFPLPPPPAPILECCAHHFSKALNYPLLENNAKDKQLILKSFLLLTLIYLPLKVNGASLAQGN